MNCAWTLAQLELFLESVELKFMYMSPSSEEPMRHWWTPPGHEPYTDADAEANPFPDQASVFWALCEDLGRPPTQVEFCNRFYSVYKSYNKWSYLWENQWTKWGAEARVRRTYPSLIREYHLFKLLEEVFGKGCVDNSEELDHNGVDFLVKVGKEWFPIRTYVETRRSSAFAKDKADNRHAHKLKGAKLYDLCLKLGEAKECGCFKLYSLENVLALRKEIYAGISANA